MINYSTETPKSTDRSQTTPQCDAAADVNAVSEQTQDYGTDYTAAQVDNQLRFTKSRFQIDLIRNFSRSTTDCFTMSAVLSYRGGPGGNNASQQGTTVGGSKPLHRFIKGQPKIIGIVVLVLGASFLVFSTVVLGLSDSGHHMWSGSSYGFLLGTLFIICGILYIVTEHNPTKKTAMIWIMEWTFVFYSFVGAVIFIVMSSFAGAALRSSKSQAIIVMTAAPAETPAE
ncbi:hypothetical protein INR49_031757 [Caranx melampygus]|nr:hypothetical protein INR49_031757 [Caranx melampygus]